MPMIQRPQFAAMIAILWFGQIAGCGWFIDAEQRIARAEQRIAAADDRGALIELQNAVRSEPENARAHVMLAEVSLRLGDPKSADKELAAAIEHGATKDQAAELSAKIKLALGDFKTLLAQLDSQQIQLAEPLRSTYRGLALLGLQQVPPAIEAFNQALAADSGSNEARVGLAEALIASGQSEAALQPLASVIGADAKNATAWMLRGTVLARRGDFKSAADALKTALENAPGQLSASQYVGILAALTEAQLGSGNLTEAKATHAELVKRAADAPFTKLLAARIALMQQDYGTAVAEAQKAVIAAPNLMPAKMLLGVAFLAQGNLNQAEAQLSDVVRQAPENIEARKLLARVNLQLQRPDLAMQVLGPAQQSDGSDPQLDALLGWASLQRGDDANGIALLERSVAAQPANAALKLDLAAAYVSAGQNDKAIDLLRSQPAIPGDTRRNNLLITAVAASKGIESARVEIDRIAAQNPDDVGVLNLAGAFYARQGNFDRARRLLGHAMDVQPKNVTTLMNLARVEAANGNNPAALSAVEKILAVEPANAPARLARAEISVRTGDIAEATRQLEAIRADDVNAAEPRLLLARLYLQQRKAREADEVVREVQARSKKGPGISNAVGRFYLDAGRYAEALNQFKEASRQDAGNTGYLLDVARAQIALSNNADAEETLQKITAAHPDSIPATAALTMLDLRAGRTDAARNRVAALKKVHPKEGAVAMLEGDVAMATKSYAVAADAYAAAAESAPSGALALRTFRARQLAGRADAVAALEVWLQREPDDVAVGMALAEAYVAKGQPDRAIQQYERALQAKRPNAMALNNLAWLYHEAGDARAAETAKRAYEMAPKIPAIADTFGWILVQTGQVAEGVPILQKAASDSQAQPDIRYHYAAALAKAGQRDAARRELRELSQLDAKYSSAADARKLLEELGG